MATVNAAPEAGKLGDDKLTAQKDEHGRYRISPTDVSQFIRLNQCRRYLRLRLHDASSNPTFMREYGVTPQAIPPLLSLSGGRFEEGVVGDMRGKFSQFLAFSRDPNIPEQHDELLAVVRQLQPGESAVGFQPKLKVNVGSSWLFSGALDILLLERDSAGVLTPLIVDVKSTDSPKVEHHLQVAYYAIMLAQLFKEHGVASNTAQQAILYRGPDGALKDPTETGVAQERDVLLLQKQRDLAHSRLGADAGFLDLLSSEDAESFVADAYDLVMRDGSVAQQVAEADFEQVPFHLESKCDGCLYNQYCMKWSEEKDDLSLIPYLSSSEKSILRRHGVRTVKEVADLKVFVQKAGKAGKELRPAPEKAELVAKLSAARPVSARLDELVYRARLRHPRPDQEGVWLRDIPYKGYGSLPACTDKVNSDLVRVYVDAQHDYLNDRIYMLGSLVVVSDDGVESGRSSPIVHATDGPPCEHAYEEALFRDWVNATVCEIIRLSGQNTDRPVHLIFYTSYDQRLILEGLSRCLTTLATATPVYDLITQQATFDSDSVTFLDKEIRSLRNYDMLCQSLQAVSTRLGFNWEDGGLNFRRIFRERFFDALAVLDNGDANKRYYTLRSRFSSQIPLEYAYVAWGALDPDDADKKQFKPYKTGWADVKDKLAVLQRLQSRRMLAIEHVAKTFRGNEQSQKTSFDLSGLGERPPPPTLAQALDEFVTMERIAELATWRQARHAPPVRRMLAGDALVVRYLEADQEADVPAVVRENERRRLLEQRYLEEYRAAHPDAPRVILTREQKAEIKRTPVSVKLRVDAESVGMLGADILEASKIDAEKNYRIAPTTMEDNRPQTTGERLYTPTAKQLLHAMRVTLKGIAPKPEAGDSCASPYVVVSSPDGLNMKGETGFVYETHSYMHFGFRNGERYTLEPDPTNWSASHGAELVRELRKLVAVHPKPDEYNVLYDWLASPNAASSPVSAGEVEGQKQFLAGLVALHEADPDAIPSFEDAKRAYIGGATDAAYLLVQGPPGTGKSYTTAWAVLARIQGAMCAGRPARVILSCHTHAATDVLLESMASAQKNLREMSERRPEIFDRYFKLALLDVPLFREETVNNSPVLFRYGEDESESATLLNQERWVVAATPGGVRKLVQKRTQSRAKNRNKSFFAHHFCDLLVLDEASQLGLPGALMAALPLTREGRLIVVGDHRQMAPIIHHTWTSEGRRTFKEHRTYESLFRTLWPADLSAVEGAKPVQFTESFRLHCTVAEFLRQAVYRHDGILFFSNLTDVLPNAHVLDPYVSAVLSGNDPLVVVEHGDREHQLRNPFEAAHLVTPILKALLGPAHGLTPEDVGVVVPHRAQRAELKKLTADLGPILIDTVEKFQGDERKVIVVSATESDPEYLLATSKFLFIPTRLTVALSRAQLKMIVVASRSVFEFISSDSESFADAQLWKKLLRYCDRPLWSGECDGVPVSVWGVGSQRLPAASGAGEA